MAKHRYSAGLHIDITRSDDEPNAIFIKVKSSGFNIDDIDGQSLRNCLEYSFEDWCVRNGFL